MPSLVDFSQAQPDPNIGERAYDYVNKMYQYAARRQAGQQYAAGDIPGAARTIAGAGDFETAGKLTDRGTLLSAGEKYAAGDYAGAGGILAKGGQLAAAETLATKQIETVQKQQEVMGNIGSFLDDVSKDPTANPAQAWQLAAQNLQAAGIKPEQIAQFGQQYAANPKQLAAFLKKLAKQEFTWHAAGNTLFQFDKSGNKVAEYKGDPVVPFGYDVTPMGIIPKPGGPYDPNVIEQRAAAQRRGAPLAEPLVITTGPDNKPIYTPRSEAAGQQAGVRPSAANNPAANLTKLLGAAGQLVSQLDDLDDDYTKTFGPDILKQLDAMGVKSPYIDQALKTNDPNDIRMARDAVENMAVTQAQRAQAEAAQQRADTTQAGQTGRQQTSIDAAAARTQAQIDAAASRQQTGLDAAAARQQIGIDTRAPTRRSRIEGNETVTEEYNPATRAWTEISRGGRGVTARSAIGIYMQKYQAENPNATAAQIADAAADFSRQQNAVRAFATGPQGETITRLNTAVAHLDTLQELGRALDNGDVPAFNRLRNTFLTEFGSDLPTNFRAAAPIVAGEIAKAIIGATAGTREDRANLEKTINDAMSKGQLAGAAATQKALLRGQLQSRQRQYEQATGRKDFAKFLSGETIKELGLEDTVAAPAGPRIPEVGATQGRGKSKYVIEKVE